MPSGFIVLSLITCALWASVGIAIKVCVAYAPPIGIASVRMILSVAALWAWLRWQSGVKPFREHLNVLLVVTVFYCLLVMFTHVGFNHTSAARGIVLLNTTPIFVALLANWMPPHEPLFINKWLGLLLAFAGVVVIFLHRLDGAATLLGDGIMLLAAISWGFHTLWTKRATKSTDLATLTLFQFSGTALALSILSLVTEQSSAWQVTPTLVVGLVYLALVGTVMSWLLWGYVLKHIPASRASSFIFTVPLFGVVLSWLLLDELITPSFIIGAILVSAGIVIVNWQSTPGLRR